MGSGVSVDREARRAGAVAQMRRHPSRPLTTGQVAALCWVAPRTAAKWVDTAQLRGHRLPGSDDRRVFVPDLVAFLLARGYPLPPELDPVVLGFGLGDDRPAGVDVCGSGIDLGAALASRLVVGVVAGDADGAGACRSAAEAVRARCPWSSVVLVLSPDVDADRAGAGVASAVFRRPCDWSEVVAAATGAGKAVGA